MTRRITGGLAAVMLISLTGCSGGSQQPSVTVNGEERRLVEAAQAALPAEARVDEQLRAQNGVLGSGYRFTYTKLPIGTVPTCTGGASVKGFTFSVIATATEREVIRVCIASRKTANGVSVTWFNNNACADSAQTGNAAVAKLATFLKDSANLNDAQATQLAKSLLAVFFVLLLFS